MTAQDDSRNLKIWLGMVLGLSTLLLYLPALRHGFVQYDDQQYVTENPIVQAGLTWKGVVWAFGFHAGNWHPLTWLSHMLDCQIYGARAGGHHLTNALLHAASTVILFLALEMLTGKAWRAAAVAALFGWHPLHVESVAWIAERKDVLCGFFWMLSMLCYVKFKVQKSKRNYMGAWLFFALAMMSKPMAVTLPFVLLLLDYWNMEIKAGAESLSLALGFVRLILEKVPFFLLSALGCVLTMMAQREAIVSTQGLPLSERLTHTLLAYFHYLTAAFVPVRLGVFYPYEMNGTGTEVVLAGVAILVITVMAFNTARAQPYFIVGWLWFLGTLVPVIGLVQVGDQAWADRYTYLPLIGIFVIVVWGAADLIRERNILVGIGAAMLAMSSVQLSYWKDTKTLFEHTYNVTHENYMALTVLGSDLAQHGKLDEAIDDYRRALSFKPNFPEAHFFLGNAFDEQGKMNQAIAEYEKALWYKPISEQTHIFLGILLGKHNRNDEAVSHYRAALKINPDSPVAHNNLARILHSQGHLDEAVEHYRVALELDPKLALAHNNLGILLLQQGKTAEGIRHLREALRLKPDNAETEYNLALALNDEGQWSEAEEFFKKSVGPKTMDAKAHYEFGRALFHLKKTREAMSQYASALLLQPDFPDALDGLAWILATSPDAAFRNGAQAVGMADRACQLTGRKDAAKLKTLGAADAEAGRFADAIKTTRDAMDLAQQANRKELAQECQAMLEQFKGSKAWRD